MTNYFGALGASNDWYTPKYVFDALGCEFDVDVAAPVEGPLYVPAKNWISHSSLDIDWTGFVWMNAPFGGRNGLVPWLDKFFAHGNGIALTPDRTSADWWRGAARRADMMLHVFGKVKFIRPDGSVGPNPGDGVTLFAAGARGCVALQSATAAGLGLAVVRAPLDSEKAFAAAVKRGAFKGLVAPTAGEGR